MDAPHRLGRAYETSLADDRRRRDGIHYTPSAVVADLVDRAIAILGRTPCAVFDPTCGGGAFLLGALDALVASGIAVDDALRRIKGADADADAVAVARAALELWATGHGGGADAVPDDAVRVADALVDPWPEGLDLIIGNPPFGGQLRGSTVRDAARADRAASILGRPSGYADTAGLFLARAVDVVDGGGVVVFVQPMSVIAARDAGAVRDFIDARASIVDIRFPDASAFDASVHVCAPILLRDGGRGSHAPNWSEFAADALDLPTAPPTSDRTLGDLADVTAGFRDEFYAVARFVGEASDDDRRPRFVTSGAIEPGRLLWGERPATVLRRRFDRPVVDVDGLRRWASGPEGDRRIEALLERRSQPKVLVATQTSVVESVVDPDGALWPSVPVVSVLPRGTDVWSVFAVVSSSPATAWIARRSVGTGLSPGALRVSARVLRDLPLPGDAVAWRRAADLLRDGASPDDPAVVERMAEAYRTVTVT